MVFAQTMTRTSLPQMSARLGGASGLGKASPLQPLSTPLRMQRASRTAVVPQARGKLDPSKIKPKYDSSAVQTPLVESAFTRRREVFVGRLAMTGFFAATIGELITGKGALGQLALETNLPPGVIKAIVAGIVIFNAITALNPGGTTFSEENQQDVRKRPAGGVQKPGKIQAVTNPKEFLGISDKFGFTKKNELFVGRVAMLGFAAELIGELAQGGKGPLGQLGFEMPMFQQYGSFGLAGWVLFFFAAAVGAGNFPGQQETGEDIY